MYLRCFGECEEGLFPRRTVLLANSAARTRPTTSPCAPTRPASGMAGFWTRQVWTPVWFYGHILCCSKCNDAFFSCFCFLQIKDSAKSLFHFLYFHFFLKNENTGYHCFFFFVLFFSFLDMPCMKRVYMNKKASVHHSAARKKERFVPVINR